MKLILSLVAFIIATIAYAVPARPGWQTKTQPDGSTIQVRLNGDEFYHYYQNQMGNVVQCDSLGYWRVVDDKPTLTTIKAHRQASPMRKSQPKKAIDTLNIAERGLVILVNFSNESFNATNTQEAMNDLMNNSNYTYNGATGSVRQYFSDQSDGQYTPHFDVIGPVTLANTVAHYGGNDASGYDLLPGDMVVEACSIANAEYAVDFTQYDNDGDGYVDFVYIIYAGKGEADGGADNTIWPHSWDLESAYYYDNCSYGSSARRFDGKYVNHYACSGEIDGYTGKRAGIGTITHEFSHVIGLPDLYDIDYGQNYEDESTPGSWHIMDGGSYNNDGNTPPNYTIYDKYFLGWKTPTNPGNTAQMLSLKAAGEDGYNAYQITSGDMLLGATSTTTAYYIENRQQTGWDAYLPGHGLVIWKVMYNQDAWDVNGPNATDGTLRYTIVSASGNTTKLGTGADPFPGFKKVTSWQGISSKPLLNITEADGLINFSYIEVVETQEDPEYSDGIVTFDADVDKGNATTDSNNAAEYVVTKDGVTMTVSRGILGTYNNEMHYRIYKGQTLTINSIVGNIVKIEFICTANGDAKYGPGCLTVDTGSYSYSGKVGTWTGEASELSFKAYTNQVRATQIVVTIDGDSLHTQQMDTIYYVNSQSWSDVNVYAWNEELGSVNATWPGEPAQMTGYQINGYDVYYYVAEQGEYTHCIFNSYSGMQTDDLVWSSGKYYYNDVWYTYDELLNNDNNDVMQSTYTVAGSSGLLGTHWDVADTTNNMTLLEDGTYQLIKTDLSLVAGTYEYKVVRDHSWDWCRPSGPNQVLSIDKDGIYTVTFTLDLSIETISATAELQQEVVVIPKVFLIGTMNDWDYTATELQLDSDSLTASVTVMLSANTTYDYQMVVDGNWFTSYDGMMTRDNSQNWQFEHIESSTRYASVYTDIAGEYTFVWNYADNTVSVIYPDLCSAVNTLDWYNGVKISQLQSSLWHKIDIASITEYATLTHIAIENDLGYKVNVSVEYYATCDGIKIMQGEARFPAGVTNMELNFDEITKYLVYMPNADAVYLKVAVEAVAHEYAYIHELVCDGFVYVDHITGDAHLISSSEYLYWEDVVKVHSTLDSIYVFYITPIVAPEMLHEYTLEAIGAMPHLVAGQPVDTTGTAEAIMAYYQSIDRETVADVVRVEWVEGANDIVPCDADYHYMILQIETDCDDMLVMHYEFPVAYMDPYVRITTASICEGVEYYWDVTGETYNLLAGSYAVEHEIFNENGCLIGIEYLELEVQPRVKINETRTIYSDELPYLWTAANTTILCTDAGLYKIDDPEFCTTYELTLLVCTPPISTTSDTICEGDFYEWHGMTLTESGLYVDTIFNDAGDIVEIEELRLTIRPYETRIEYVEISSYELPYLWTAADTTILCTDAGLYKIDDPEFCTTYELELFVRDTLHYTVAACDEYTWHGQTFTESGLYKSIIYVDEYLMIEHTLDLIIHHSVETELTDYACDQYVWGGIVYTESGDYIQHYDSSTGCDSTVILHLHISHAEDIVLDTTIYEGEACYWYGNEYTVSGEYYMTFINESGCEYNEILRLTVLPVEDRNLLMEIREDLITNNAWQTPWDVSTSVSSWRGVELYNGHVIEIDLSSQGLMGTFPTKILQLPHLEYLSLADNQLTGDAFAKIQTDMTTFVATNPTFVSALIYLDISYNQFTGNVGIITAMSKLMPNLSTLQANNNRLKDVVPMIPKKIHVDLSEQDINHYVHLDLSNLNVDPMQLPTILLYDHLGQTYFTSPVAIDITNYSPNYTYKHDDPWGIMIDKTNDYLTCLNGEAYRGKNGDTLYLSYPYADVSRDSYCRMTLSFEMGDANFVDGVNVADLQSTILYAFGGYNNCAFNLTAADTYTDNRINVQDVIRTVDILLAKADINTDSATMRHIVSQARAVSYDAEIVVENNTIKLITNQPIAALQISAIGDVQWLLNGIGMEQTTAHQSVVAYSLAGNYIPAGETIIGYCQGNVEITQAELSDAEARMVAVSISGKRTPTEMENIEQTTSEQLIYDVLGRKHDSMQQQGLYIIKSNNQYIKVYNHQ